MKKELVSFVALFLLATTTILAILLITTKRQMLQAADKLVPPTAVATPIPKIVKLPAPRTYAATIALPTPKVKGVLSVEQAIAERRSQREYTNDPLTLTQLSQMLWSGQGVTDSEGKKRTAPSAREVYPYTLYILVRNVTGLAPGLYEYLPSTHALGSTNLINAGELIASAGVQEGAQKSPVVFLLAAALDKGYESMKDAAVNSAYLEGGHIAQNMYLEAQSLKLGMVVMGGFDPKKVGEALNIDPAETIVYVVPIGVPVVPVATQGGTQ